MSLRKAKAKPEKRAGVYMIRNPKTGDSYIGASTDLATRLDDWRSDLRKLKQRGVDWLAKSCLFEDVNIEDIEFRIIEYVTITPPYDAREMHRSGKNAKHPDIVRLLEREKHWIAELAPNCNCHDHPENHIVLDDLPVGPPEPAATS